VKYAPVLVVNEVCGWYHGSVAALQRDVLMPDDRDERQAVPGHGQAPKPCFVSGVGGGWWWLLLGV
jgi:hypothetical protein